MLVSTLYEMQLIILVGE